MNRRAHLGVGEHARLFACRMADIRASFIPKSNQQCPLFDRRHGSRRVSLIATEDLIHNTLIVIIIIIILIIIAAAAATTASAAAAT